jgi:hypothetical protein
MSLEMPYGYYQLVRFAALSGFALLAYNSNKQGHKTEVFIYILFSYLISTGWLKSPWVDNCGIL